MLEQWMDKWYGGWLGKTIGVIHGANIEGWTYERIKEVFGPLTTYPYHFTHFAADDDINGPIFFMRALADYGATDQITAEQMGKTMLNYVADGHGFFWWGGYGVSTEHTAYVNLKNGIPAPASGSIEQNGTTVAEQIGGQIFSDCWGLVYPGEPEKAAQLAAKMSSVTHDGNGIYGGMFIAACIASAFVNKEIDRIIADGLAVIPQDSAFALMARQVLQYCEQHPDSWEAAFKLVQEHYGYQHYEGVCHIMPNAAVIVLSLVYGKGDFSDTINICNMCGWDTDCNVGNVGTIVGVLNGAALIENHWKDPINDFICASSVIGSDNIATLPRVVEDTAKLALQLRNEQPQDEVWKPILTHDYNHYFHFELAGSTHAITGEFRANEPVRLRNTEETAYSGKRSLEATVARIYPGNSFKLKYKTYYVPADFDDSRYDPDFSPVFYPGQTFSAQLKMAAGLGAGIRIRPYMKNRLDGEFIYGADTELLEQWTKVSFHTPAVANFIVEEIGFLIICYENPDKEREQHFYVKIFMDDMIVERGADYEISYDAIPMEKWNAIHQTVAHLTYLCGIWKLENGDLCGSHGYEPAESYTGLTAWRDYQYTAEVKPLKGERHYLLFRVQGAIRSYAASLMEGGYLALFKKDGSYQLLDKVAFPWKHHQAYQIEVTATGNTISIAVNGELLLTYVDEDQPYLNGHIGFGNANGSRTAFASYRFKELVSLT